MLTKPLLIDPKGSDNKFGLQKRTVEDDLDTLTHVDHSLFCCFFWLDRVQGITVQLFICVVYLDSWSSQQSQKPAEPQGVALTERSLTCGGNDLP